MSAFFDTSALLKAYVREQGTAEVQSALRRGSPVVSRITYAELLCATGRACREGVFTQRARDRIWDRIERDFASFEVIEVRAAVLGRVRAIAERHPLRTYDAVQLATAVTVTRAKTPIVFWCADWALLAAARAEGLRVHQPTG